MPLQFSPLPASGCRVPLANRCRSLVLCALLVATAASLPADSRVAVVAHAEPDYLERRRDDNGALRTESYFILEGTYFPGQVRDRTLERTTLVDIARLLAPELAKQSYAPAPQVEAADLMLVVHWGTTVRAKPDVDYLLRTQSEQREAQDFRSEFGATLRGEGAIPPPPLNSLSGDFRVGFQPGEDETSRHYNALMGDLYSAAGNWTQLANDRTSEDIIGRSMADMLGFSSDLQAGANTPFGTLRSRALRAMLEDERYFIIVIAYDFKTFRSSGYKEVKRLWTCRLSMHSPGINFRQAVFRIGSVGSNYFGTNSPTVTIKKPELREGTVDVGEPTVVSW
jgi:hypothetical protein